MSVRPCPNRRRTRRGRAANRNRRRRQNNGTPLNVNAGNHEVGVVANNENNVVVDVAANNVPIEDDLNVAVVPERIGNVNLGDGPALNGPVVNAERVVELAARTRNVANGPEDHRFSCCRQQQELEIK